MSLKHNFFAKHKHRHGLLGSLTISLAFIRAVEAAEADAFSAVIVQDFEGVAVEDKDYFEMILRGSNRTSFERPRDNDLPRIPP